MQILLMMLSTTTGQFGGVQEDALLTIGVLVEGEGREEVKGGGGRGYSRIYYCVYFISAQTVGFIKYMDHFHPYLSAALKNYTDIQVPDRGCPSPSWCFNYIHRCVKLPWVWWETCVVGWPSSC